MQNITFEQLAGLCAVALVLIGAYNTVMTAIKNRREERQRKDAPVEKLTARLDAHDQMLARDKRRIEEMEERISMMGEQSTIMLRGVRALLSHGVNGNSTDKLKDSMTEIDEYLISRK